jgi:histidyl-tRNA synthetase
LLTVARHVAMYQLGDFEVVLGIARGFTFYTSTVFEISAGNGAGGAKYCGGGRYDRLVEEFGGPPLPSTGCGFRFDDIVDGFIAAGKWSAPRDYQLVLVAASEPTLNAAVTVAEQLRGKGLRVGVETAAGQAPSAADCEKHKTDWIGTVSAAPSAAPSATASATPRVRLTNGVVEEELPLTAEALIGRLQSAPSG